MSKSKKNAEDVADAICEAIASAIVHRELRAGMKLPEDTVGEHFGVSRTIVHNAFNRLQREHLVEFRKNRGAFVAQPTIEEAKDLLEAREFLECAIVRKVALTAHESDIEALRPLVVAEERAHLTHEVGRGKLIQLSGDFHVQLAALANNGVLFQQLKSLVKRTSLVISFYGGTHSDDCGAHDHETLINALLKRDSSKAVQIMSDHICGILSSLRLDDHGELTTKSLLDILDSHSNR